MRLDSLVLYNVILKVPSLKKSKPEMKKNMGTLTHTNFWVSEKRNEKKFLTLILDGITLYYNE